MNETLNSYSHRLESAVSANGVTGASFAYWDGSQQHTATSGLRNSVTGDPVTLDTVMHVGSITKLMNAVLLMQLVDEGRISLEDPVIKHVPEFRLQDAKALRQITCQMLLNHTSGIDGDLLPEHEPDQERIVDAIDRCAKLGQLHAPGEGTSYCNIATVVAGYLTQKLRGVSWYTLVKERIYKPLGLQHSLVDPLELPRFRCSIGHVTDEFTGAVTQAARPFLAPSFAPAGATQMMTATNLVTFARALLNGGLGPNGGRILSAASAERMARRTAAFTPMPSYQRDIGLGWGIGPGGVLSHSGSVAGTMSGLHAHPASGRVLVLLRNSNRFGMLEETIVDPIVESWTGIRKTRPVRQVGAVDPLPYEGTFENNMQRFEVVGRDGVMMLRATTKMHINEAFSDKNQSASFSTLYSLGDHAFEKVSPLPGAQNMEMRFVRPDSAGRMCYLALWGRLFRRSK